MCSRSWRNIARNEQVCSERGYDSFNKLLVEDTYPTLEGIKNILEIQATIDPKAAMARPEDFVDFRFLDELKKIGYLDKLYGRS